MTGGTARCDDAGAQRGMAKIVLGLLAAGALALFAVTRAWASATVRTPGVPVDTVSVSGVDAAPILAGLAVVVVAGALAVVAAGGWFRQLIGLVIAAVAGFAALRALTLDAGGAPLGRALKESPAFIGGIRPHVAGEPWPWVAAVAFALACAFAVVVALRGRQWARMSARYERDADSDAGESDDVDLWRAQDRGQDPTR